MTIDETKEFLLTVRRLDTKIQRAMLRCEALRASLLPSGIRYDLDKIQTSPADPMSTIGAQIVDLEAEVKAMMAQKCKATAEIALKVAKLENDTEQAVLYGYYIGHFSMEDIADRIHYSRARAYSIRREGVEKLSALL